MNPVKNNKNRIQIQVAQYRQSIWLLFWWFFATKISFWGITLFLGMFFAGKGALVFLENILLYQHVFEALVTFYVFLHWFRFRWQISPHKIIVSKGVFYKFQKVVAIKNIESVSLHQNVLQQIFGLGTLSLSAPTLKKRIRIINVNQPLKKMNEIEYFLPKTDALNRHKKDTVILG